ncbi:MAG TPA: cysteine desulfurase family protein [Pirellulales bacterium]|jgi:cysteine desulfurase|nr:cysteine desulfurase family protein [Pirellulales bacterium]
MRPPIYLDHNATAPLLPEVAAAMAECHASGYGNPASQHSAGRRARQRIDEAVEAIARLLGANVEGREGDRIIFTSGGTEANNLAIFGLAEIAPKRVIVSAIEHPSVAAPARQLERRGWRVERIPVSRAGVVELAALDELLAAPARLVSVMLGNNETGAVQPAAEIARRCRAAGALTHADVVQAVGKLPIDFRALGVDAMTISAHKLHGPVGIGALVMRRGVDMRPLLYGGAQQEAVRPGTESIALIVGFQRALDLAVQQREARAAHLQALRDRFEQRLLGACPEIVVHARGVERLPHTSNLAFVGADRQALLIALDLAGVACSAGSACASGSAEPSPTLVAMGCPKAEIDASLRFSLGAATTAEEIDEAAERILRCFNQLRLRNNCP